MESYRNSLKEGGALFLSGFYNEDLHLITDACTKLDLKFVSNKEKNNWVAAKYIVLDL